MANFIIFLDRIVNLYLYFVLGACMLSWVPNMNPDYPFFHFIFKFAGFYLIPPVMGVSFSPAIVMLAAGLLSMALRKIFNKYYANKAPQIIVLTKDELLEKLKEEKGKGNDDGN